MAHALSVTLLGGFRLTVDGAAVELPTGAQRLVALLAMGERTSRSRLAGTLWPDTTERRALGCLRTGLWRVNQVAAGLVDTCGASVALGRSVDVDVRRLVRCWSAALAPDAAPDELGPAAGELLPDWEDEWLCVDRERLRQLRLHALEAVATRLSRAGRYGLALEAAHTALRADPTRESAHRAIIGIHLAEGNVVEARRAVAVCHAALRRDAGVEPSAAVAGLVERVGAMAG